MLKQGEHKECGLFWFGLSSARSLAFASKRLLTLFRLSDKWFVLSRTAAVTTTTNDERWWWTELQIKDDAKRRPKATTTTMTTISTHTHTNTHSRSMAHYSRRKRQQTHTQPYSRHHRRRRCCRKATHRAAAATTVHSTLHIGTHTQTNFTDWQAEKKTWKKQGKNMRKKHGKNSSKQASHPVQPRQSITSQGTSS